MDSLEHRLDALLATEADLTALMEHTTGWASAVLARPTDSLIPTLIVRTKTGPNDPRPGTTMMALAIPFNEHKDKHAAMRRAGRMFYKQGTFPVAATLTSECWLSIEKPGEPHVQPRDDPNRREGIVVSGMTLGTHHTAMTRMLITRDQAGNIVPAAWQVCEGTVENNLLKQFYYGFLEETYKKFGPSARR